MNPFEIMKQAKELNDRLQGQLGELRVEGSAGGGMVTVVLNGFRQLLQVTIDPEVVSKDEVEMLQDLVVAAVNDANRKVEEELKRNLGGLMGGLSIPGLT
jgi:DNA-binding YbaB/EbfC family protein